MIPKWFNVNEDAQIWAGHADNHKQFLLQAPAAILAIDEYQGSYQFEKAKKIDPSGEQFEFEGPKDEGYPQLWIRKEDVTLEQYEEDPVDDPVDEPGDDPDDEPDDELIASAALVGAAIQIILEAGGSVTFPAR